MDAAKIRILLVEDSPVAATILKRLLATTPDLDVVGWAHNGLEALEVIPKLQPDVICTDLHMPKMDGLAFTQAVMRQFPRPILVVSASVQPDDTHNVFELLQAGAVDVFPKPETGLESEYATVGAKLIQKIRILAGVKVFTQRSRPTTAPTPTHPAARPTAPPAATQPPSAPSRSLQYDIRLPKIIAIGASTGGPQAVCAILKPLPANFPIPIVCVQHISEGFLDGLVSWLQAECALRIAIAPVGTIPQPGTVYFPPEGHHLGFDGQGRLSLNNAPPVSGHRPSVTVLFQAVAAYYRQAAVGILLTGMGRDGAEGLLAIAQAGGTTIAQDEATSVVFGMPKEAIQLNAAKRILPLPDIAPQLLQWLTPNR